MGFFTRNQKDDADASVSSADLASGGGQVPLQRRRPSASAQRDHAADELRRRARRRLVGAIAMVLAAIIVLPMVLDSPPDDVTETVALEIPSERSSFDPQFTELPRLPELPAASDADGDPTVASDLPAAPGEAAAQASDPRVPASIATITPLPGSQPSRPEPEPTPSPSPPPSQQAAPQPTPSPAPQSPAQPAPDSEAARALALLEGRATPEPSATPSGAATEGRYAVQVVAVRSRSGADELLARLRNAGLSAYIETVRSPQGEVHRVRLGPFSSRSQAESAQNRLQGLPGGYQGNLVPL